MDQQTKSFPPSRVIFKSEEAFTNATAYLQEKAELMEPTRWSDPDQAELYLPMSKVKSIFLSAIELGRQLERHS